jgi:hypothetical protein
MMMLINIESPAQRDTVIDALKTAGLKSEDFLTESSKNILIQALQVYKQKCLLNIEAIKDKTGTRLLTEFFTKRINTTEQLINQIK